MSDFEHSLGNAQTIWIDIPSLAFETLEQAGGFATVIRFHLNNQQIRLGDALVVMEGSEIRFHGMITHVDEQGRAVAADRRGSSIPAGVH